MGWAGLFPQVVLPRLCSLVFSQLLATPPDSRLSPKLFGLKGVRALTAFMPPQLLELCPHVALDYLVNIIDVAEKGKWAWDVPNEVQA